MYKEWKKIISVPSVNVNYVKRRRQIYIFKSIMKIHHIASNRTRRDAALYPDSAAFCTFNGYTIPRPVLKNPYYEYSLNKEYYKSAAHGYRHLCVCVYLSLFIHVRC